MASISDRVGDLGGYLREQREHAKLSVRQLAALAGVSNPYLSQVERGLRKPSAEVLQQIAKGLRISAEALYVRAGILEEHQGLSVELAITSDATLTERQKRVLLDIYTSFAAENARAALAGEHDAAAQEADSGPDQPSPSSPEVPVEIPAEAPADATAGGSAAPSEGEPSQSSSGGASAPASGGSDRARTPRRRSATPRRKRTVAADENDTPQTQATDTTVGAEKAAAPSA